MADDAVMTKIGQAVMLHRGGDREEARTRLAALWARLDADAHPLQRCTLAHFLAGTQDDPHDRLAWDLRALHAAETVRRRTAEDTSEQDRAVRSFYPSLRLSLAADYVRLHQRERARAELAQAVEWTAGLADDAYGRTVRTAIGRVERALDGIPEGRVPPAAL
ncbi:hypothetical protein ACFQLX_01570 [Streptomyces polyrhachis]|uniref:Tetratricopeptide repeat protein n=1 Tax=Streptomyces polyrhachis TaxID=1282885 RepID=A0ABW2G7W1_9ACTN